MENHGRDPKFELPKVQHPPLGPALCVVCGHTIGVHRFEGGACTIFGCSCWAAQRAVDPIAAEQMSLGERPKPDNDPVNHPSHYTAYSGIEVIQLTEQMNFNRGNAVKYIARAGLKNPETELEDLEKARWYIDREIERIKKNPDDIP